MKGKVICELLNVRKTPEKANNVVATVRKGEELNVEPDADGWLKAENDNLKGYVMAEFVEIEPDPETPEEPDTPEEPETPKKGRKKAVKEDGPTGETE